MPGYRLNRRITPKYVLRVIDAAAANAKAEIHFNRLRRQRITGAAYNSAEEAVLHAQDELFRVAKKMRF